MWGDADLAFAADAASVVHVAPRDTIFEAGQHVAAVYLLCSGSAQIDLLTVQAPAGAAVRALERDSAHVADLARRGSPEAAAALGAAPSLAQQWHTLPAMVHPAVLGASDAAARRAAHADRARAGPEGAKLLVVPLQVWEFLLAAAAPHGRAALLRAAHDLDAQRVRIVDEASDAAVAARAAFRTRLHAIEAAAAAAGTGGAAAASQPATAPALVAPPTTGGVSALPSPVTPAAGPLGTALAVVQRSARALLGSARRSRGHGTGSLSPPQKTRITADAVAPARTRRAEGAEKLGSGARGASADIGPAPPGPTGHDNLSPAAVAAEDLGECPPGFSGGSGSTSRCALPPINQMSHNGALTRGRAHACA